MTTLPRSRTEGFTRAEWEALPDDWKRYEAIDGVLIVSPSPRPRRRTA